MGKKFTSEEGPLGQLLELAHTGVLQLPDFQRGWVWDDNHIVSLSASISLSYPIGAVMTLQTGNPDARFRPRMTDREGDGIVSIPADRLVTTDFGRSVVLYLRTRDLEIAAEMFPLDIVLDTSQTMGLADGLPRGGPW